MSRGLVSEASWGGGGRPTGPGTAAAVAQAMRKGRIRKGPTGLRRLLFGSILMVVPAQKSGRPGKEKILADKSNIL